MEGPGFNSVWWCGCCFFNSATPELLVYPIPQPCEGNHTTNTAAFGRLSLPERLELEMVTGAFHWKVVHLMSCWVAHTVADVCSLLLRRHSKGLVFVVSRPPI